MSASSTIGWFLYWKWMEEGGGLNLVIITPRRQRCEQRMAEYLKDYAPRGFNGRIPEYLGEDLEEAFRACCSPVEEEHGPN